jgi:magnesium transporter
VCPDTRHASTAGSKNPSSRDNEKFHDLSRRRTHCRNSKWGVALLTIYRDANDWLRSGDATKLPKEVIWIDLLNPTADEKALVESKVGVRVPSIEALSEIESSSRLIVERGVIYLSTPAVAQGDTHDPVLSPIGFILSAAILVTIRFAELPPFEAVAQKVRDDEALRSGTGVFTTLLEAMVDRGADVLERLGSELDQISRSVFHGNPDKRRRVVRSNQGLRQTLTAIGVIGNRLSQARDVFLGIGRIVPFVVGPRHEWIVPEFESRLGAVSQDVASLNDYEAHLSNKVQFLLDAVLGYITIEQNDLFKVLTIVSVIGIPPTLVAGIYGMNFKSMPELDWAWGYPFGLAVIALSALIPMAWMKWRGWF